MPRVHFLACLAVAAVAPWARASADADELVPRLTGRQLASEVLASDDAFVVLADAPQCGKVCDDIATLLAEVATAQGPVIRFGRLSVLEHVSARATGAGRSDRAGDDDDERSVGELWGLVNKTTGAASLPALLLFSAGPKAASANVQLPPQAVVAMARGGAKAVWAQLSRFVPSVVETVHGGSVAAFVGADDAAADPAARARKGPPLPRVLLFTAKLDGSVAFKKLSMEMHGRAVFGQVSSALADVAATFGVSEFPTLLVSPPGAPRVGRGWRRYEGSTAYAALRTWLNETLPAAPVPVARTISQFEAACLQAGGVCVLGLLGSDGAGGLDADQLRRWEAAARRMYVAVDWESLSGGTVRAAPMPVRFVTIDGDAQPAFAAALGVTALPAAVALNPRKKMAAALHGAFEEGAVRDFVINVVRGDAQLRALDRVPTLAPVAQAADDGAKAKAKAKPAATPAAKDEAAGDAKAKAKATPTPKPATPTQPKPKPKAPPSDDGTGHAGGNAPPAARGGALPDDVLAAMARRERDQKKKAREL
jgi:hypothetical protein